MPRSTVSLCLIVRDEASMLRAFLPRIAGLCDEICAVDTGSVDETPALLLQAGARVVHRAWNDDFSAARNASLEMARGEWVLVLDADEMVPPELAAQVRAVAAMENAGAATVRMRNALPHGHVRESDLLRMFRNDPSIRYCHVVHEDVTEAVESFLARTGQVAVRLTAPIEHLGYTRDRSAARGKKERDSALLRRCIAADPTDLYSHFKLLELARFWGDAAMQQQAAPAARDAMQRTGAERLRSAHFGGALAVLVADGLFPGNCEAALEWLSPWVSQLASFPMFLRRAELREALGDLEGARQDFTTCLDQGDPNGPVESAVRPLLGLARIALRVGLLDDAATCISEALARTPRDPEALLAAVTFARLRGSHEGVSELVTSYQEVHGDVPELHLALGDEALVRGDATAAVAELAQAAGTPPRGRAAVRLAQALTAAGRPDEAREVLRSLEATQSETHRASCSPSA